LTLGLNAGGALADTQIGDIDLNGYCRHVGFDGATLEGPVHGSNAAYGWRCSSGSTRTSIDVDAACRWEHGRDDVYSRPLDVDDAYSWRCFRRSPPPSTVTQLDPVTYHSFDGYTLTLVPWQGE